MTTESANTETPWYRRTWVVAVVAFVFGGAVGQAMAGDSNGSASTPTSTTTTLVVDTTTTMATTTTSSTTTTTAPTTTTTEAEPLTTDDVSVSLFIIEDECFNTAGALVTVEPDVSVSATVDQEYLVVYEISGVEGGSETYNLTLHDDGTYTFSQEQLSTESCDHDLQVNVTAVRPRG